MITKFIKKYFGLAFALAVGTLIIFQGSAFAGEYSPIISEEQIKENSQIDINLPAPNCVSGGYYSSICGKTAKEKYWSALRKYFSAPVAAGIMGNIVNEGGLNPASIASCNDGYRAFNFSNNTWVNGWNWDTFYNSETSPLTGKGIGIGAFGIYSGRTDYLQYINDNAPNLLEYFKHPEKYSYNICGLSFSGYAETGDALLHDIGDNDFNALVELEVGWMYQTLERMTQYTGPLHIDMDYFKGLTDVTEAAAYFARKYENCEHCTEPGPLRQRGSSGQKIYDELKDFQCSGGGSTSRGSVNPDPGGATDITLIGDSISVISEKALEEKFPTSFLNKVGSRHPTSKGSCPSDEGGLAILEKLANGSGVIVNQSADDCGFVNISSDNLKNNVVWALGTNSIGAHDPDTIKKVINLIGNRRLFLVTPYNGKNMTDADTTAELYRSIANDSQNNNVFVVDWNKAVRDNPSTYLSGDQVHPTAEGSQLFAQLIFDAVSGTKGCTTYTGEYPEYKLDDPRWTSVNYGAPNEYGNPRTIGSSGCGVMSMAMLTTAAIGQDVFPDELRNFLGSGYYNLTSGAGMVELDKKVCEKYGCEVERVDYNGHADFLKKAKDYLSRGYMLHMSARCEGMPSCPPFSPGGHYIGIFSIKDDGDTVMVADSTRGNKEYSLKKDITPVMDNSAYTFSAIRGPGGGGSCANLCKTSQISSDGLTEEQARKIALYYNGGNTDAEQYDLPHGKNNCVSFSKWFVMKFTGLSWAGGHGRDVAHTLAGTYGLPQGTEPRPYALFSTTTSSIMCDNYSCGHTGIVVAVDGNDVTTLEASYSSTGPGIPAHIVHRDISYFKNSLYTNTFTYLDSVLDKTELEKIAGR